MLFLEDQDRSGVALSDLYGPGRSAWKFSGVIFWALSQRKMGPIPPNRDHYASTTGQATRLGSFILARPDHLNRRILQQSG
jgi:hypothetical protein